jgi:hypothetical protein
MGSEALVMVRSHDLIGNDVFKALTMPLLNPPFRGRQGVSNED